MQLSTSSHRLFSVLCFLSWVYVSLAQSTGRVVGPFSPDQSVATIVSNGDFETVALTGWTANGTGGNFSSSLTQAAAGTRSVQATTTAAGASYRISRQISGLVSGQQYVLSGYFHVGATTGGTTYLDLNNIAGDVDVGAAGVTALVTGLSAWQFVWRSFTATSTTVTVRIVREGNPPIGEPVWVDQVAVTPLSQFRTPANQPAYETASLTFDGGQATAAIAPGEWKFYSITIPPAALGWRIVLSGSGDNTPNLYVNRGSALPTTSGSTKASVGRAIDTVYFTADEATTGPYLIGIFSPITATGAQNFTLTSEARYLNAVSWDPGLESAGTNVAAPPRYTGGDYFFKITTQTSNVGAWRTALRVISGTADIYLRRDVLPTPLLYTFTSARAGTSGDGFVVPSTQFSAGQDWYILVTASADAEFSLISGDVYVQNLGTNPAGTLPFTDVAIPGGAGPARPLNGQYDIGEPVGDAGSGPVTIEPEGMRFFKASVPTGGIPAWSLSLRNDSRDLHVRKAAVPLPSSSSLYDRKRPGQMLLVPPYLGTGSDTYFFSVSGNPGEQLTLDSRIQEVTVLPFGQALTNVEVPADPYRVYRVDVPAEQLGWDVAVAATLGNPNLQVRRSTVPSETDNDGFSHVGGSVTDSLTIVPETLSNGTWFITVSGTAPYKFDLKNGSPVVTSLNYDAAPPATNVAGGDADRAGWRYYRMDNYSPSLGWELLLNAKPGTELAIRRNKLPGRWNRQLTYSSMPSMLGYVDVGTTAGFIQRPAHQADVWYVGIYNPQEALGNYSLESRYIPATPLPFNGGTSTLPTSGAPAQPAAKWTYFRVDVPPEAIGWDLRLKDVSGGLPQMVVRRDLLPDQLGTYDTYPSAWSPANSTSWASGRSWASAADLTGYATNPGGVNVNYRRFAAGMGRPLEPGTYYVGVRNSHATAATSYTFESRGVGPGMVLGDDLAYLGGSIAVTIAEPRETKYYHVIIPTGQPSWEIKLEPTTGEVSMAVRRGTIPDLETTENGDTLGTATREVLMRKTGPERYVLLPANGQSKIPDGSYYIAVVSSGSNPTSNTIGEGSVTATLTSVGPLAVKPVEGGVLDVATTRILTQNVSLAGGQIEEYRFELKPGATSIEVKLNNLLSTGDPGVSLVAGINPPQPYPLSSEPYGYDGGQTTGTVSDNDIVTIANPVAGEWRITVRATPTSQGIYQDVSAQLVVSAFESEPLIFDGGAVAVSSQAPGAWKYFRVNVPASGVVGWDLRLANVNGARPKMVVRREELPDRIGTYNIFPTPWSPSSTATWGAGRSWASSADLTGYGTDPGSVDVSYRRFVAGVGRPLDSGATYYIGVYNAHATTAAAYTIESRGMGPGMTFNVGLPTAPDTALDLEFQGGTRAIALLASRETQYYRVNVPAGQSSWQLKLEPTSGELSLAIRRGTIPDLEADQNGDTISDSSSRQILMRKTGQEHYVLLPANGQSTIAAGAYYVAVISSGANPSGSTVGGGNASGNLTSVGPLSTRSVQGGILDPASTRTLAETVSLAGGEIAEYRFELKTGATSIEVRLNNLLTTGDPGITILAGVNHPAPYPTTRSEPYGYDGGQVTGILSANNIVTVGNPIAGEWRIIVRASPNGALNYQDVSAELSVSAQGPMPLAFNGGALTVAAQSAGAWTYFPVTVPASGAIGWDVRLKDVNGGAPQMVIRRDQLPDRVGTYAAFPTTWEPSNTAMWPTGRSWASWLDLTGYSTDPSSASVNYRRFVAGMERPLQPGTYYIGVYNSHTTAPSSYTIESRGIGPRLAIPVTLPTEPGSDLAFLGGTTSVTITDPRDARYFKVEVPSGQRSWELKLEPSIGEWSLAVRQGTIPDLEATETGETLTETGSREILMRKAGAERYVLLPGNGQSTIPAGPYYLVVISAGVNPVGNTVGVGVASATLTSVGPLVVTAPIVLNISGPAFSAPVILAGGQLKNYSFVVPPGSDSLQVRLGDRVGDPGISLVAGAVPPAAYPFFVGNEQYGYDGGQTTGAVANDHVLTVTNPIAGEWQVLVRASAANSVYPEASATLVAGVHSNIALNFDRISNGNGLSHTDTRQMTDGQKTFYQVEVPAIDPADPTLDVLGWLVKVAPTQGDVTLRISKVFGDTSIQSVSISGNVALIVRNYLSLGERWHIEVLATGTTTYTISSEAVTARTIRDHWTMPQEHNIIFGDSDHLDSTILAGGFPEDLTGEGVDLGQDDWHFYSVTIPAGNRGLIRTELQAFNGNPNLYIREGGLPTTDHYNTGGSGVPLIDRQLTSSTSEYGNWVPLDGRSEKQLPPGVWYLGVKADGATNARYRLRVSTGYVQDVDFKIPSLPGGPSIIGTLFGNDWRYFRFVPPPALENWPLAWRLTFSQQQGDVVMWLRDTVPPGQGKFNDNRNDYIESWASDAKNNGDYSTGGYDSPNVYEFRTPALRPGATYYVGFRSNNDASFEITSETSGMLGVLPVLNFNSGAINTILEPNRSVLYEVNAPPGATVWKHSSTHASSVQVRIEQGSLPKDFSEAGTSHYTSSNTTNSAFTQPLGASWPWRADQTYYVRVINTSALPQPFTLQMSGGASPAVTISASATVIGLGGAAVLNSTVTGDLPRTYQWRRNNANLSDGPNVNGSTMPTLQLSNLQSGQAGNYTLTVANGLGTTTSNNVALSVVPMPVITSAANGTTLVGQNFIYTITANNGPISFSASGLPGGLSLNETTGEIFGRPTSAGLFQINLGATNLHGTGVATVALTVAPAPASIELGQTTYTYDGVPKPVSVITTPFGLPVTVNYGGSSNVPTNAGSYGITATISDPNYIGSRSGTLVITRATAVLSISGLAVTYNALPQPIVVTTSPADLPVIVTYNGSSTPSINAGSSTVYAEINSPNYQGSRTETLVIAKATASVSLANTTQPYDGLPKPVTAVTAPSGLNVEISYAGTRIAPSTAGVHPVLATVIEPNYFGATSGQLTISPRLATISLTNLENVYDGTPKSPVATTTPGNLNVTLTYNGSGTPPTEAGIYEVVARVNELNHDGVTTAQLVIAKAPAIMVLSNLEQTYDGSARIISVDIVPAGVPVAVTYNGLSTPPTNAGAYEVVVAVSSPNYTGSQNGVLTVGKAAGVVTLSEFYQVYDGTPKPIVSLTTPIGLSVTTTYNGSATLPLHSGIYEIVTRISDTNYEGTASGTLNIERASATVLLTNTSQPYTGTPRPISVTTTPGGLPVAITYNGNATAPTEPGVYGVIATVTDPNYVGAATGSLTIGSGGAVITLSNASQIYDGLPKPVTVTTTPVGLSVILTYDGISTPPTNAGAYTVVATINDPTYSGTANATLTIEKAPATINILGTTQSYNGTPRAVTVITTPLNLATSVTYNGNETAPTNAGGYSVDVSVNDLNYTKSAHATLTITKGNAVVTLDHLSHIFDGTPKPATATTQPAGLAVTLQYSGAFTAPSAVGSYEVIATITDANYQGGTMDTLVIAIADDAMVDQQLLNSGSGEVIVRATQTVAQTFKAGISGFITRIDIPGIKQHNGPIVESLVLELTTTTGGLPSNQVLATRSLPPVLIPGSSANAGLVSFDLSASSVRASAGDELAIVLKTAAAGEGGYAWSGENPGTYAAGMAVINGLADLRDMVFRTWMRPVSGQLDQHFLPITPTGGLEITSAQTVGQTFTVGVTGQLTQVDIAEIKQHRSVPTENLVFELHATSGGLPTLPVLASRTLGPAQVPPLAGQFGSVVLDLSELKIAVTAGDMLAILLKSNAAPSTGTFVWGDDVSGTYTRGSALINGVPNARDMAFRTFVDPAPLITSNLMAAGKVGDAFEYSILASNAPTDFDALSLPTNLSIDHHTGIISGVPTVGGFFPVTLAAFNRAGTGLATLALSIAPATGTITFAGLEHVFDGTPKSVTVITTPAELPVIVRYNDSTLPPTAPGTYTVVASINSAAYSGTATGTLTIANAAAEISITNTVQTYTGTPRVPTVLTAPANLEVALTYDGSPTPPTNAGTYTVLATINDPSYLGTKSSTFIIKKAVASLTITNVVHMFDGAPKPVLVTTMPAGLSLSINYDGSPTVPTAPGSYSVVAAVADANYEGTQTATLQIMLRPLNVTDGVQIIRSGLRLNRASGRFAQTLTIKNTRFDPITGPVSIVLDHLSANATLWSPTGVTSANPPLGNPFVDLFLGTDGHLDPSESITLNIEFTNSSNASITYITRVLASPGIR